MVESAASVIGKIREYCDIEVDNCDTVAFGDEMKERSFQNPVYSAESESAHGKTTATDTTVKETPDDKNPGESNI
ncbi:UNVERIFIED_CONTAM: hypothetical protein FKN15_009330 [Acipenser sinensis]